MDAIKDKFNNLQPREKKMIYALLGVAVVGAIVLFKPDGKSIEEIGQGAVADVQEMSEDRDETIRRLAGEGSSGGGTKMAGGATRDSITSFKDHNSLDDCWVVLKGTMYDITSMLEEYPGGNARIEKYCGTLDFEDNFNFEQVMSIDEFIEKAEDKGVYKG